MRNHALILVLISLCCGCSVVRSTEPFGGNVQLDPSEWDGLWTPVQRDVDGHMAVRITDAAAGTLMLEDENGDEHPALVREAGDWTIVNLEDDDYPGTYLWVVVSIDGDTMLVWAPDKTRFAMLVDSGQLPGEDVGNDLLLYPLSEDDYDLITSERAGVLLNWKEPVVLQRAARRPAPEATP